MKSSPTKTVSEYIKRLPKESQAPLKQLRAIVKKMAPDAEEGISYGIPVFKLNGKMFVYIAGFKNHTSLYPAPRGNDEFKEDLAAYKGGKGTVQFPLDKPLPVGLIKRIIKFRIMDNKVRVALSKEKNAAGKKRK
jgi:uncharacterized protein YdhG (YjbR/CyaY superfamily)